MKIMVIQGPNINMLGMREPAIYGVMKMEDIHKQMKAVADQSGNEIEFFQSNFEGEIIDKIQECFGTCDGIIINPAAYTHTSLAIRDALAAVSLPVIEVHISNIARREELRQKSLIAPVTAGQIIGFGPVGYHLAMIGMIQIFEQIKAARAEQKAE
ncbi:type II 3-dehydroquinate dehydratase [Campylobacter sp.]|uniref:type II 3-dehydroquinate dehydratase n=1 Tax=Campylobacter sp. TaxID=205 RepID=UPI0025C0B17E|nr:type II 3-dehydroquinate dehydratase [Campylobacter sp.]